MSDHLTTLRKKGLIKERGIRKTFTYHQDSLEAQANLSKLFRLNSPWKPGFQMFKGGTKANWFIYKRLSFM